MTFSEQEVPLACSNILWFDYWGRKIQKVLERLEGNGQGKLNVDQQILKDKKISPNLVSKEAAGSRVTTEAPITRHQLGLTGWSNHNLKYVKPHCFLGNIFTTAEPLWRSCYVLQSAFRRSRLKGLKVGYFHLIIHRDSSWIDWSCCRINVLCSCNTECWLSQDGYRNIL